MSRMTRLPLVAAACFALSGPAWAQSAATQPAPDAPQWFAEMLDASKLPRMAGAQELFASKATTMLVVRDKVAEAAAATRALLTADGWQPEESPSAQSADATHAIMNFRKGEQGLNVFIGVAPAQGGATTIQYTPVVPDTARREAQQRREAQRQRDAQPRPARAAAETAMVDVSTLPRPEGAYVKDEDARKNEAHSFHYMVPGGIEQTKTAVSKLLAADGWVSYVEPLEKARDRNLAFKKGGQGVSLFFTTDGYNTARSGVWMTSHRIYNNVPFPPGATDVVYDYNRPLMDAIAPGTVESLLQFFRTELAALGWHDWSSEDAARYPNAKLEEKIDDGVRAYFARDPRDRKDPIQVSLGRRNDGRVDIEVRVPPFARPQELAVSRETYGLPIPDRSKSSTGRDGQTQREVTAMVAAERDVVLKFYQRELGKLGWKEDARGPVSNADDVMLGFTTADGKPAQLTLGLEYDLTTVNLVQQLPDKIAQARAKAKREAEEAARKRAEEWLNPPKALEALATPTNAPLPVPDTAEKVDFDAARGDMKFTSTSPVKEITAFYRKALASLGFKENATPIDDDKMAALDFTRGGKRLYVSIMRIGARTDVRSYGPGLLALAADPRAQQAVKAASTPAQPAFEELEADTETTGLPVPKQVTMSFATDTPFGREREATVKASLDSTLAFYRRELTKLGWTEASKGAVIKPSEVKLDFKTPDGSATLVLGREDGKTTVKLTQRTPSEAEKKGIVAKPGMGLIVFGSALETEAVVTINRQTIKLPPGNRKPDNGPKLDLKPGTYKASVKIPGKTFSEDVKIASGQTIGLLIGPGGVLSLPLN
jgi:hypothetical protein